MCDKYIMGEEFQEITGNKADSFSKFLWGIEEDATEDIILDFAGVTAISSIAMGSLFAVYQKMMEDGKKLIIINASEKIMRLLQMVNMAQVIGLSEE